MKTLTLNNFWRIETDNDSSTLIFAEKRIRKEGNNKGERFIYEQSYYYNTIESALRGYFYKTLDESKDLKDVLKVIKESLKHITNAVQNTKTM